MEVGLSVYDVAPGEFVALAQAAEEAGFGTVWLGEHIVLPLDYKSEHPSTTGTDANEAHRARIVDPDTELLDPLIALGAAAAVTTRIKLATGIYIVPLRHPLAIARMTLTLQGIAGGRFMLGVGSGWLEEEFDALGVPFAERGARFDEALALLQAAWSGDELQGTGPHYPFARVLVAREPVRVPLILGGNTDRAMRRTARLADGWFSSGNPTFDEARRLRGRMRELNDELGRERPLPVYVRMAGCDRDQLARYAEHDFEHVAVWANQLWPDEGDLVSKRERFLEAAGALLRP